MGGQSPHNNKKCEIIENTTIRYTTTYMGKQ
jgi:hypothetical protein